MEFWKVDSFDGIVVAAYNRPPMNYMDAGGIGELKELIRSWDDPKVRVAIITGNVPDKYITHYSVEELVNSGGDLEKLRKWAPDLIYPYHQLLQSLTTLDIPVIAAMSGDTMGCGLELSLNCDIRIAQRGNYVIGFPEVARSHDRLRPCVGLHVAQPYCEPRRRSGTGHCQRTRRQCPRAGDRGSTDARASVAGVARCSQALRRTWRKPTYRRGPTHRGRRVAQDHRDGDRVREDARLRQYAVCRPKRMGPR